ncbi:MAG: type II secretion system minor pseudopilin GspK, partial [Wenzhouxiangellaceae bacterium]
MNARANPACRQRGAALLIALLAVALAAVLATEILERTQRDLARTQAVLAAERAWQFSAGLDGLAREWVRRARETGVGAELLDGRWSQAFEVAGGGVRVRLMDPGGRFNLNVLASPDPELVIAGRQALVRLLRELDLDPALAAEIGGRMRPAGGARPVRLAHPSELERLEGWTPEVRRRLLPFITVLPDPETRLNLNRTSPEVLAAWVDGLDREQATRLLAQAPFASLDQALSAPELARLNNSRLVTRLTTESDWFMVHAQVELDGELRDFHSLMHVAGKR